MIYTLTLAPAIDLFAYIDKYEIGGVNRLDKTSLLAGGKGINVSRTLKLFNCDSICLGLVGGKTGEFIIDELNKENIKSDFVQTKEMTRINIKFKNTAFNSPAPSISKKEIRALIDKLSKLKKNDILIISGRVPDNILTTNFDKTLISLKKRGVIFIVDSSSLFLSKSLKYKPFLIKPNMEELGELFNKKINDNKEIIKYARKLIDLGVSNVLVSLGPKGALLVNKSGVFFVKTKKGKVINTVGCGDSLLAGFVAEYLKSRDYKKALIKGVATGTAVAFYHNEVNYDKINNIEAFIKR